MLHGESGNDALIGGPGFDELRGADGSDRFLESDEKNNSTWADLQKTGNTVTVLEYGPSAPPVG